MKTFFSALNHVQTKLARLGAGCLLSLMCALMSSPPLRAQEEPEAQIEHYSVKVRIDHKRASLAGDCEIQLRPGQARSVSFAIIDGTIERVEVNQQPAVYEYQDIPGLTPEQTREYDIRVLSIELPQTPERVTVRVVYRDEHFYGTQMNPEDNTPFSNGQITAHNAFSSHLYYYPYLDHTGQSGDIYISTNLPGATAISSGELMGVQQEANGYQTFHFHSQHGPGTLPYPFAIAAYETLEALASDGKTRLQVLSYPEDQAAAAEKLEVMKDIFAVYHNWFGEYPFAKLAVVETKLLEGSIGLAAQSVVMLSQNVYFAGRLHPQNVSLNNSLLTVLADEMNHQWNAYKVMSPNYLAEGISRYVDALYLEHLKPASMLESSRQTQQAYFYLIEKADVPDLPISDPEVYPALYFIKGAAILHMLRGMLGEEAFRQGMQDYFSRYTHQVTSLDDFRHSFEAASRQDLKWFFEQWYQQTGWPKLKLNWTYAQGRLRLQITQTQAIPFRLDQVPLQLHFKQGQSQLRRIDIQAEAQQTLEFSLDSEPSQVRLDPEGWTLKQVVE